MAREILPSSWQDTNCRFLGKIHFAVFVARSKLLSSWQETSCRLRGKIQIAIFMARDILSSSWQDTNCSLLGKIHFAASTYGYDAIHLAGVRGVTFIITKVSHTDGMSHRHRCVDAHNLFQCPLSHIYDVVIYLTVMSPRQLAPLRNNFTVRREQSCAFKRHSLRVKSNF